VPDADRQAVRPAVVVPTYNEAENIAELLHRVRRVVPTAAVIVVDGASPDGTAAIARHVAADLGGITVVEQRRRSGLGGAYREGFALALAEGHDPIVEMDADLSHDPADIPRLLRAQAPDADLLIGSRYVAGGGIEDWSRLRRQISRQGNRYAGRMLGIDIADLTSGFRVYRAATLRAIRPERSRANGYALQVDMARRVVRTGGRVTEVPIVFTDRRRGSSKMSLRIVLEAVVLVAWWGLWDRVQRATGIGRSLELFRRFRREPTEPDRFYDHQAADTVGLLGDHVRIDGALAVDVGGGAGHAAAALRRAGARCVVIDPDHDELTNFGRAPEVALLADGRRLPIASGTVELYHSSNVLEHVPDPVPMLEEMMRVLRPGRGVAFVSFTNWLSPWGGHETSPWHYLGGPYARRRYERTHGRRPKNGYGTTLFRLDITDVLRWLRRRHDIEVLWIGPRYLPGWLRWLVSVPGLREVVTWNLAVILRRTQ
jgi:glycosyltransferase involved in cell wall biosynthesis/SAM-dependent methyltransferase